MTHPEPARPRTLSAVTAVAVAWALALTACTGGGGGDGADQRRASPVAPRSTDTPRATPTPTPMPGPDRPVAGTRAALSMLSRPDVHPTSGYLAENGALLVRWELRGLRDRQVFRCDYPVVVTWASRAGWSTGIRNGAVHAWLLADGERGVEPTRTGFYVSQSTCAGRDATEQAPPVVVDEQGRLRATRVSTATTPPRDGAISVSCPPRDRGYCQLDPRTRTIGHLPGRFSWDGTWRAGVSLLWRSTSHISGTWSVDGGGTWNQFIDPWDATALRVGGTTFAVSNGVQSSFGELVGGFFREGYTEWAPEDRAPVVPLPRSEDGYRSWRTAPDGTLVGIGRAGVYVSEGTDWSRVTRRDAGRCRGTEMTGGLLSCGPLRQERGLSEVRVMLVSDDLGRTWSRIILNQVVPPMEAT